jgi:hypothetical protein
MAAPRSSHDVTLDTPTLEPARAGFTNTGRPSSSDPLRTDSGSSRHRYAVTVCHGATGMPACCRTVFVKCLSMPSALASTPLPTYGRPTRSSIPCTVPSSPQGPCRIGKTTSTAPSDARAPSAVTTASSREAAESGQAIREPLSSTCGSASAFSAKRAASSGWSVNAPSRVMPIGMTS